MEVEIRMLQWKEGTQKERQGDRDGDRDILGERQRYKERERYFCQER